MTNTERVTYRPEGSKRARTIYLEQVRVVRMRGLGSLLSGIEVDREGDEVHGKGFDERQHLIHVDAIVNRVPVVMDKIYGEFVEVPA